MFKRKDYLDLKCNLYLFCKDDIIFEKLLMSSFMSLCMYLLKKHTTVKPGLDGQPHYAVSLKDKWPFKADFAVFLSLC